MSDKWLEHGWGEWQKVNAASNEVTARSQAEMIFYMTRAAALSAYEGWRMAAMSALAEDERSK